LLRIILEQIRNCGSAEGKGALPASLLALDTRGGRVTHISA